MSDMVTHWASFEDCRRLAQLDEKIEPRFRKSLEASPDIGRLGTLTRGGNTWMPPLLNSARENARNGTWSAKDERNLAFVLGCLIHQACDFAMKPLLSRTSGQDWNAMQDMMADGSASKDAQATTQEISAYYDAEVFKQVYLGGNGDPLNRFFLGEASKEGAEFERFVRAAFQRALLSSHTLKPDLEKFDEWLENLFEKIQPLYLDVDLWVKVYNHPEAAKLKAYGVTSEFYDVQDPCIRAARELQAGRTLDPALKKAVYEDRTFTCAYGEILQLGIDYLRNATRFWTGEISVLASPNDSHQKAEMEAAAS